MNAPASLVGMAPVFAVLAGVLLVPPAGLLWLGQRRAPGPARGAAAKRRFHAGLGHGPVSVLAFRRIEAPA